MTSKHFTHISSFSPDTSLCDRHSCPELTADKIRVSHSQQSQGSELRPSGSEAMLLIITIWLLPASKTHTRENCYSTKKIFWQWNKYNYKIYVNLKWTDLLKICLDRSFTKFCLVSYTHWLNTFICLLWRCPNSCILIIFKIWKISHFLEKMKLFSARNSS